MNSNLTKEFSKRIIMFVIVSNCIAFVLLLAAYIIVRTEPSTLIISWYTFTGTECLALAGIKITEKMRNKNKTETTQNQDSNMENQNGSDPPVG